MFGEEVHLLNKILEELQKQTQLDIEILAEEVKQTNILQNIFYIEYNEFLSGVQFFTKGKPIMAGSPVTVGQGQSVPVELHYVDANGNDLGLVPAADNAVITVDQPAEAGLTPSTTNPAQVSVKNTNTGSSAVTVTLTGVAKGFTGTVQLSMAGVTPPPPTPSGVTFVVGTPA